MDVFAANDLAAFTAVSGTPTENTGAGNFDAAYTNKAIQGNVKSAQFANPETGAALSLGDGWIHYERKSGSVTTNSTSIQLYNSAGTVVVRGRAASGTTTQFEYWDGAAWVALGTPVTHNVLLTYDIHLVAGAGGSFALYTGQSEVFTVSGLAAAVDDIAFFGGGTDGSLISQVLVSDESTIGAKVASMTPNANGTYTAWANDYANIVKTGYNDATLISSSVLADKETYGATDATLPPNYVVSSLWLAIRARLNSGAPANIAPLLRYGAADHVGAYNFPRLNAVSYAASLAAFPVDPATGTAWDIANINAAELGFQTAA